MPLIVTVPPAVPWVTDLSVSVCVGSGAELSFVSTLYVWIVPSFGAVTESLTAVGASGWLFTVIVTVVAAEVSVPSEAA